MLTSLLKNLRVRFLLLVLVSVLPALGLLRRTRWERGVIWSSSCATLLVGVILFVERAFL